MSNSTVVYVVGDVHAPKTNQWSAMTNNKAEAVRLMSQEGYVEMKEVKVPPPRRRKK